MNDFVGTLAVAAFALIGLASVVWLVVRGSEQGAARQVVSVTNLLRPNRRPGKAKRFRLYDTVLGAFESVNLNAPPNEFSHSEMFRRTPRAPPGWSSFFDGLCGDARIDTGIPSTLVVRVLTIDKGATKLT
ncbi:MAG: hypothetical protein GEU28_06790 [Dehalococcoidia bacterium]|nr:hypothetical protein [Dehalococcoidia bacterium]